MEGWTFSYANQLLCQGNLASGLVQNIAKNKEVINPPAQKTAHVKPFHSSMFENLIKYIPTTMLTQPQITLIAGLELGLKGVICCFPQIPCTKCGIALNRKTPAKKAAINFIIAVILICFFVLAAATARTKDVLTRFIRRSLLR